MINKAPEYQAAVAAQKEIKVLKEEFDLAFDAGYDAAQESVSEWLEALEK